MAFQKSLLKIIGSLGGLNFYQREGQFLVRTQSRISKARILKDPAFARTRENMAEFGAAAALAKDFRQMFGPTLQVLGKTALSGRVTALMKRINVAGEGERGQRSFQFKKNRHLLKGFDFYPKSVQNGSFWDKKQVEFDRDEGNIILSLPNLNPAEDFQIPSGATHFQFLFQIGLLSDVEYDSKQKRYQILFPEFHGKSKNKAILPRRISAEPTYFTLNFSWDALKNIPENTAVVMGFGILFLTQSGEDLVAIEGGQGFNIAGV